MPIRYTDEQKAWIAESYPSMTNSDLARSFSERFGVHVTASMMRAYGANHRLRKSAEIMARRNVKYTDEMREFLRQFIPNHSESEIIEAFDEKYGIRLNSAKVGNLKVKLGVRSGTHGGRFPKGNVPANKGRPWSEWMPPESAEGARRTQFKRGQLNGIAKERDHGRLGERVTEDGYREIRVDPRRQQHTMSRWIPLGAFNWMRENGRDWPDGCRCVHADGNAQNDDAGNIVPVPAELWPLVNGANPSAIPWHDRESLELAVMSARVTMRRSELARERRRIEGHPWASDAKFAPR